MVSNYFNVLGVHPEATNEELRKAFHREALRWHPDKNPTRIQEATERFKLIARAYDALCKSESYCGACPSSNAHPGFRDSRFGFCNQCAGNPNARCSCNSADSEFSMEAAMGLFREIFGEDIKDALAKLGGAAGHVANVAGNTASKVACGLSAAGQTANFAGQVVGDAAMKVACNLNQWIWDTAEGLANNRVDYGLQHQVPSVKSCNFNQQSTFQCCRRRKHKSD